MHRQQALDDVVFVGFNSRVAAMSRKTGEVVWQWKSPKGSGYVTLQLLDDPLLVVSVHGYMYGLDPTSGAVRWMNEMKGFGWGVTSIVAKGAEIDNSHVVASAAQAAQRQAAQNSAAT